jgi:glucose-6-phosphate 1-epimerase
MAVTNKPETKPLAERNVGATQSQTLGRVSFLDGQGELPMLEVTTAWSTAEIYLHGAHLTRFTKKGEPSLLFVSQFSRFTEGQAIRGGIPVILPWFGMREGMGQHGFARVKTWELKEFVPAPDGSVSVRLCLPDSPEAASFPPFSADYIITVSQDLSLELVVKNKAKDEPLVFENCLHSYFEVGDITAVSITGL